MDLAIHPEWKEKCRKEIQDLVARHAGDSLSTGATLYEKLAAIPFSGWEGELPILDACMQESQRIALSSVTLRRNVREDMKINGQVIKRGDFLAYPFADVHFNPEYYPEPYKYDPGRWLGGDSTPNTTYPFIGWGAGRHPCTGMRVAKLEIKLISAVFLAGYEFDLVDKDGKFPNPLPAPDRDNIHQVCVGSWMRSLSGCSCFLASPRWSPVLLRLQEGRPVDGHLLVHPSNFKLQVPPHTLSDSPPIRFIPDDDFARWGARSCISHYHVIYTRGRRLRALLTKHWVIVRKVVSVHVHVYMKTFKTVRW